MRHLSPKPRRGYPVALQTYVTAGAVAYRVGETEPEREPNPTRRGALIAAAMKMALVSRSA
jgi:hypothetical protein